MNGSSSPLAPLAWGFLALFPLPLLAMLFTDERVERAVELGMALVLLIAAGILFGLDYRENRRRFRFPRGPKGRQ